MARRLQAAGAVQLMLMALLSTLPVAGAGTGSLGHLRAGLDLAARA